MRRSGTVWSASGGGLTCSGSSSFPTDALPPIDLSLDSANEGDNHSETSAMRKISLAVYEVQRSTQQLLLDHLRRIVEGVFISRSEDSDDEQWTFGFGDDCLVSWKSFDEDEDHQHNQEVIYGAKIQMFLSLLDVESRDRPSGFKKAPQVARNLLQGADAEEQLLQSLAERFENRPPPFETFRRALPDSDDVGALEQAYAFEMLGKLGEVVRRSKHKAVRKVLHLKDVPEGVDDFMAEAVACYRYGFDKACLAVCRTALEEMLKRRIERDHGRRAIRTFYRGREVNKNLETLITEAHKTYGPKQFGPTYLDDQLETAADRIRRWGNGAVHGNTKIPDGEFESMAQKALLYSKQILRRLWEKQDR